MHYLSSLVIDRLVSIFQIKQKNTYFFCSNFGCAKKQTNQQIISNHGNFLLYLKQLRLCSSSLKLKQFLFLSQFFPSTTLSITICTGEQFLHLLPDASSNKYLQSASAN